MAVYGAYVSSTLGMMSQSHSLNTISSNLANINTGAYKANETRFSTVLSESLFEQSDLGGIRVKDYQRIDKQGSLIGSDRDMDVAINGKGFFQVRMPDGNVAFTRDGSFQLDQNGQMVTSSGYPLEPAVMIPENALSVSIGKDGLVTVTEPGSSQSVEVGQLTVSTFVNPAGLESIGENLYLETTASGMRTGTLNSLFCSVWERLPRIVKEEAWRAILRDSVFTEGGVCVSGAAFSDDPGSAHQAVETAERPASFFCKTLSTARRREGAVNPYFSSSSAGLPDSAYVSSSPTNSMGMGWDCATARLT